MNEKQKRALVQVLTLAENSHIWSGPTGSKSFQDWKDGLYQDIQTVRQMLRDEGVPLFCDLLAEKAKEFPTGDDDAQAD
jgi:hypothetical protein